MSDGQLDPRAIKKISGPAWNYIRPTIEAINSALLGVDDACEGQLTTIYVKYLSAETKNQPYAVLWLRKSAEVTLGLALPQSEESPLFVAAPRGCTYAGLTKYLVLTADDELPTEIDAWSKLAYQHAKEKAADEE